LRNTVITLDTAVSLMEKVATQAKWKVSLTYNPLNRGADDPTRWVASIGSLVSGVGATPEEALVALRSALSREGWQD